MVSIGQGESDATIRANCEISKDVAGRQGDSNHVIVSFGLPYHASMNALEPIPNRPQENQNRHERDLMRMRSDLDHLEGYMIISALPIHKRCSLLWDSTMRTGNNHICSPFAFDALSWSIITTLNHEISTFLLDAPWPDTTLPSDPSKLRSEDIRAVIAAHFPALFTLINHQDALNPRVPVSGTILQVLRYVLASARPQRKRDFASISLIPLCYRRTRAIALLDNAISELLESKSYTEAQITDFFESIASVHSVRNPAQRDTAKVILRRVADLTKKSEHAVVKGKRDANDILGSTRYIRAREWDRRVTLAEEAVRRIEEDERAAREVLGRMVTEKGAVVESRIAELGAHTP